jgi:hypothetical protein
VIGHQEDACDLPASLKKKRYSKDIGVAATHVDDPRKWYLPESAGENGRAIRLDMPWRNVAALGPRYPSTTVPQLALVTHVAQGVEKLSVQDGQGATAANGAMNIDKATPTGSTDKSKLATDTNIQNSNDKTKLATDTNIQIFTEPAPTKITNAKNAGDNTKTKT